MSLSYSWKPHLWLMLLDFNEKTCWQHLRGNNNRLHIKLIGTRFNVLGRECGWRPLCKEEIEEWGNTTNDFNEFTQAEACNSTPPTARQPLRTYSRRPKRAKPA